MPFDNNPYLLHSSTLVSKPMSDPSIFSQPRPTASTFSTPPLGVNNYTNKGGTSPLALISMQRNSAPPHQPPLLAIKEEPRLEHRPRLSLSVPHVPGKTRKRHKVATSCNRCRQNKVYRMKGKKRVQSCIFAPCQCQCRSSYTEASMVTYLGFVILIKKFFFYFLFFTSLKCGVLCCVAEMRWWSTVLEL